MSIENDFGLVKSFDKKYCLQVFAPMDVAFVEGKGSYLYSIEDKEHGIKKRKYLDMIGGIAVNSLGHGNKDLVNAISKQAAQLIHCCNYYYIPERSELAFRLCSRSFADKCFFCNSGAEANEAAIKLARSYFYYKDQPRYEIITANMSFHGRTMATLTATGQEKFRKPFEPVVPGFKYVDFNDYEQIENAITPNTAAVMLELIQGESGVHPADKDYIKNVAALCKQKGILLIIDEVQTGIGRTGTIFCYEQYGIKPDIMTLAKGLGGGVPIGAMLCTDEVATGFKVGDHGSTFGGNPLACAAANVVMEKFDSDSDNLLTNVNKSANYLLDELTRLRKKYDAFKSVRGMGLLIGMEFDSEFISAAGMRDRLFSMGILVSAIGKSTIRIAPPLTISITECSEFIKALESILKSQVEKTGPLTNIIDGIKNLTGSNKKETGE